MQTDERKHETLDILHQVVEASEALGILAVVNVDQRADLGGGERNVLIAHDNLELLAADSVRCRPRLVVLLHDVRLLDDPLQLVHYRLVHVRLLPDQRVVLIVRVVGIAQLAVGSELKLQELVSEFASVTHVIA